MTTIDMECPQCGAPGSVPRDRAHSRLVCKKCHAVFHLTPLGRPVLGEPPVTEPKRDDHHHPPASPADRNTEFELPFSRTAGLSAILAVLLVVGLGYGGLTVYSRTRPAGQSVTPRAEAVANAIAHESLETLKPASLPGSEEAASRFFEMARHVLAPVRANSPTKEVDAKVLVLELIENKTRAQVVGYFTARKGTARDQQIAEAEAAAAPTGTTRTNSADLMLWFAKDPNGDWKFDPARSAMSSRPGT
ncbi:MAG: zinc ribbon domain-containing protein [Isosphaeraceae bacterium]